MRIVVTGVPGTGKSVLSRALAKRLGYPLIDTTAVVRRKRLWSGRDRYGSLIVKMGALERELRRAMRARNVVVEGHLACELGLPADFVIVCRTDPDVLERRLKARGYPKEKREENVMAECLDYCTLKSLQNYPERVVYEIETGKNAREKNISKILAILKGRGKRYTAGWVDWGKKLFKRV
mgnify:CR=1 FL=1